MTGHRGNAGNGQVTTKSPHRNPTPQQQATREAELDAFAARMLALAPPPSERQLAALRRLARGSTARRDAA